MFHNRRNSNMLRGLLLLSLLIVGSGFWSSSALGADRPSRVPPAVVDPDTGERIVVIDPNWQSLEPFAGRFAAKNSKVEGSHYIALAAIFMDTDKLVTTDRKGRRSFLEPDLSSFPSETIGRPFQTGSMDYFLIQARSPEDQIRVRGWLEENGIVILDYIPDLAYLVRTDKTGLYALQQLKEVYWTGYFQPAFRLAPKLDYVIEADFAHPLMLTAHFDLVDYADLNDILDVLQPLNLQVTDFARTDAYWLIRLEGPAVEARRLITIPGCLWVERFVERELHNNVARTSANTTTGRGATAGPIMDVEDVWARGIRGEGQIASAADTGLSTGNITTPNSMHYDFGQVGSATNPMRVLKGYALGRATWDDDQTTGGGHGTHTSGSIVGNGIRSGSTPSTNTFPSTCYAGTAPKAQFIIQSLMDSDGNLGGLPADLTQLFLPPYNDGARVHSNSWGAPVGGAYNTDSQNVDKFCWNYQDMLITFSAGNSGTDSSTSDGLIDSDSMGAPGTAKNCVTVGASENYRTDFEYGYYTNRVRCQSSPTWGWFNSSNFPNNPINSDLMANNANGMGAFSSRGPTSDGRFKPDVTAPGIAIFSTRTDLHQAFEEWGYCNLSTTLRQYYIAMGGTSMANPLTAGACVLIRQYYTQGWHANGSNITHTSPVIADGFSPSSALVKATLINGAWDMSPGQYGTGTTREIPPSWDTGHDLPNNAEGYGRVDLEHSLFPGSGYGDMTGRLLEVHDVTPGLQTAESKSYAFTVGSNANPLIVTLVWTDPYGATYVGTELVNDLDLLVTAPDGTTNYYPNKLNNTAGTADRKNNVEQVKITSPASGQWTIRVTGYNVPGNGQTGSTVQPYALVISGVTCSTAIPGSLTATSSGNNAVDLTWASVSGATQYRVYRAMISGGPYTVVGTVSAPTTSMTDTTVSGGVTYYYVVTAVAGCESPNSAEISVTASIEGGCNLPPLFAGIVSVSSAGSADCGLNLSWRAASAQCSGLVNYTIYRSSTPGVAPSTANRIATGVTGTTYNDLNGLTYNTAYYYLVHAVDGSNGVEDTNTTEQSGIPRGVPVLTNLYGPENFDGYSDGNMANWSRGYFSGNANDWRGVMTCTAHSGNKIFRCGGTDCTATYQASVYSFARPPAISVPSGSTNTRLSFWHEWNFETYYDGAMLMLSLDGSSYRYIPPAAFSQGGYNVDMSSIEMWGGNHTGSWTNTIVDLDLAYNLIMSSSEGCSGKTLYIAFVEYADNLYQYSGWFIDDVSVTANVPGPCSSTPMDVSYLTARAAGDNVSGLLKLEWVNPSSNYSSTVLAYRTDRFPANPSDTPNPTRDIPGVAGAYGSFTTPFVNNDTYYYYSAFVKNSADLYSDGRNVLARPFNASTGWVKWAYSTGAANLAPPGVRPGVLGTGAIYDASNDRNLHATNTSPTGGDWPRTGTYAWIPMAMNGPAQGRPTVIPLTLVPGADSVVFLGSQDGYAYAANAKTGAQLWQSAQLGDVVQAPVNGMFTAYGGAYNLLFVPTRNAVTANRVWALDPANGTSKWSFDNGGGSSAMGIISSGTVVDYANRRLYFTSRARGGGSDHTMWCISFTDSGASWVWSRALGDIDSAPLLYDGRIYVGNNQGIIYALNATTGADIWSYNTGDASAVKSYIFCDFTPRPRRLYFSTAGKVWSLTDNANDTASVTSGWPLSLTSPSHPLPIYGTNYLVVGASLGRVYRINVTSPNLDTYTTLGDGNSAAGNPSFDVTNNMVLIGTAAGVLYGVVPPLN